MLVQVAPDDVRKGEAQERADEEEDAQITPADGVDLVIALVALSHVPVPHFDDLVVDSVSLVRLRLQVDLRRDCNVLCFSALADGVQQRAVLLLVLSLCRAKSAAPRVQSLPGLLQVVRREHLGFELVDALTRDV